jgi:hypothetical protein
MKKKALKFRKQEKLCTGFAQETICELGDNTGKLTPNFSQR